MICFARRDACNSSSKNEKSTDKNFISTYLKLFAKNVTKENLQFKLPAHLPIHLLFLSQLYIAHGQVQRPETIK